MPTSGDFPLQLSLPAGTDPVDISVLNANFETINDYAASNDANITAITANGWVTNDRVTSITPNKLAPGTVPSGVVVEYVAGERVYIQQTEPTTTGWNSANAGTLWISW
jgi:hypothetical protein